MNVSQAIQQRRSIKRFTNRPVTREQIESLLSLAVLAPNHKLTQPWRFYVLGPVARLAYGVAVGRRKAKKLDDPAKGQALAEAVAQEHRDLPAMIAVAVARNENPEIAEEDYAAAMMAIENLALAAVETGLGTSIKTGAAMGDVESRRAVGVKDDERIVAVVHLGEPADVPAAKARQDAKGLTTWVS
jgi:nitroreductase